MSLTRDSDTSKEAPESVVFPPSDLLSDEPLLETDSHRLQMTLLIQCLEWLWRDRNDFYASGNITIYYSPHQRRSEDFRGPDFFVVLATERKPRKSWVVWEENGKYPNVMIEILSETTANTDRGLKKQIYQDIFRTPDYFWFDPESLEFAGFCLVSGQYQPLEPNPQGHLWSQQLGLYLGIHQGQLRFFTQQGEMVPTPEEVANRETQRADRETQRADRETQRAERLAAKLRELDIDPEMP